MLSNMATSLIKHKKVTTTVAKAKALRGYVEPLLTKSKTDSLHSRRMVFAYLQDKEAVQILFDEIARKIADRPGGYTRILRTDTRLGDAAQMCFIELVDYNSFIDPTAKADAKKTRRSRRGKGLTKATPTEETAEVVAQPEA
jgi:large subunit ribosomal protein L17